MEVRAPAAVLWTQTFKKGSVGIRKFTGKSYAGMESVKSVEKRLDRLSGGKNRKSIINRVARF